MLPLDHCDLLPTWLAGKKKKQLSVHHRCGDRITCNVRTSLECIVKEVAVAPITVVVRVKRFKPSIALHENPSQSYEASLAIWDHTVLPAARHK